jgi:GR25 family glycosyltransferase involved in LPS biosynthesis
MKFPVRKFIVLLVAIAIITLDSHINTSANIVYTYIRIAHINKLINIPVRKFNEIYNHYNDPIIDKNLPKNFYVVNLDRSPERLGLVQSQAKKFGLNIQRHVASDGYDVMLSGKSNKVVFSGKQIRENPDLLVKNREYEIYCPPKTFDINNPPDLNYTHGYNANLLVPDFSIFSAGSLGNACSVRRLWKKIAEGEDNQIAIIFEDDILMHNNFKTQLNKVFAELPEKWDLIYLDYLTVYERNLNELKPSHKKALVKYPNMGKEAWGAHAYIINKRSAKKLLQIQDKKNNVPVDNILMEGVMSGKLTTYVSTVKMADQNPNLESDIDALGRD